MSDPRLDMLRRSTEAREEARFLDNDTGILGLITNPFKDLYYNLSGGNDPVVKSQEMRRQLAEQDPYAFVLSEKAGRLKSGEIKKAMMDGKRDYVLETRGMIGDQELDQYGRRTEIDNRLPLAQLTEQGRQFDATLAGQQEASRARLGLLNTQLANDRAYNMGSLDNQRHGIDSQVGMFDRDLNARVGMHTADRESRDSFNERVFSAMQAQQQRSDAYNDRILDLKMKAIEDTDRSSGLGFLGALFGG